MEYIDLTSYSYDEFPVPMLNIGWLGTEYGIQGCGRIILPGEFELLMNASNRLGGLTLGVHECEFCPEGSTFAGNGEYRYYSNNGATYAAPMMIFHYIESHDYCPPSEFLLELENFDPLEWDSRADLLCEMVCNQEAAVDLRAEAVVDLPKWKDPRVVEVLKFAANDEDLSDAAWEEIGISIGQVMSHGFSADIHLEEFSDHIQFGVSEYMRRS